MTEEAKFMEELLAEAEQKEEQQTEAYFDLLLLNIQKLQAQIAHNFLEAEKEVKIINDWALRKNYSLQAQIEMMERKLEYFICEREAKTIDLPHGVLKFHKHPDKVEITDLALFLKQATPEMLTFIPEQVKPDLTKIKAYIKKYKAPAGVTITPGKEAFSYKLKERKDNENGRQEETGTDSQSAMLNRIAV